MPNDTGPTRRARVSLDRLLIVSAGLIALSLLPVLSGIVGSLILFVLVRPLNARLARHLQCRVAAFVTTMVALVVLLLPGGWLVSTLAGEARMLFRSAADGSLLAWLDRPPLNTLALTRDLATMATSLFGSLSNRAFALVGGAASALVNIVVALFGLYYLLIDGPRLWTRVERASPFASSVTSLLASRFIDVTEALILGTGLTAVVQGTLVGAGFALVGLEPALIWGFITACVSILPLFGSALVWLPGAVFLALANRMGAAVFLLVVGLIASNIDNLIRPLIYRRVSGIHPMLTVLGAFAGARTSGPVGAFIGPLALSYFAEILGAYESASRSGDTPRKELDGGPARFA